MIKEMKIKVIKCGVGGCNSEIVMFDEEFICDESEFSFKMEDKEMEGGGNEDCMFWFLREYSEYFKMDGEEFIDKKIDCKLSEKYDYRMKLDDYWDEVNKKFGVEDEKVEVED